MIFDGGIVNCQLLTIPQSFCFAKIQPPLHKGAFFTVLKITALTVCLFFVYSKPPSLMYSASRSRAKVVSSKRAISVRLLYRYWEV